MALQAEDIAKMEGAARRRCAVLGVDPDEEIRGEQRWKIMCRDVIQSWGYPTSGKVPREMVNGLCHGMTLATYVEDPASLFVDGPTNEALPGISLGDNKGESE